MACKFCENNSDLIELHDDKNKGANDFYLTCNGDSLRLWKHFSYKGCYEINYCPMCGEKLKPGLVLNKEEK